MNIKVTLGLVLCLFSPFAFTSDDITPQTEEEQYIAWAQQIWDSLDRKVGEIKIDEANVVLNVPKDFYYLTPDDAEKVLVDVWGNPPGEPTLGLLFPANLTPFDNDSWAVTIEYEEDGYISDKDADQIDYDELLVQMKEDTRASSELRIEAGYQPITLIGWAAPPYYDATAKKLYWAQELKFGNNEVNTLNYNIRVLGRKGVLVLNFIAGMDQKAVIDSNIDSVLALAEFSTGSKYSDFNPDIDTVAAYGLGALVAGKVIAKTGFLAAALIFLKKFGIIIFIAAAAFFKRLFSKKQEQT